MAEPGLTPAGSAAVAPVGSMVGLLQRIVHVERREIATLLLSFAFFFTILCSYYLLRPIRDEMAVTLGRDGLQWTLVIVMVVMLAAVPVFGWVVVNVPRRRIVTVVYLFLIGNLLVFRTLFDGSGERPPAWLASTFFVWIMVYVLFVVSLFWSFMSDIWRTDQAKRLYGFISVGGTTGAIMGPILLNLTIGSLGLANLLLLSAALLGVSLGFAELLSRHLSNDYPTKASAQEQSEGGGLLDGALNVWRSPYLFRIALWVLAANLIGTYFYFKQAEIVGAAIPDRTDRVLLFSRIDLATNTLTALAQLFAVGRIMERIGVGATAAILPSLCVLGVVLLAVQPVLWAIVLVVVCQRAAAYGFGNPAMRTLYTVVDPKDKYRSQNFNDTVVYRGGEAVSGYVFDMLAKRVAAAAPAGLALAVAAGWLWLSFDLGRRQEQAAAELHPPAKSDAATA